MCDYEALELTLLVTQPYIHLGSDQIITMMVLVARVKQLVKAVTQNLT